MTPAEAQQLMSAGAAIDAGELAHDEAAAAGLIDPSGKIIAAPEPDPNAGAAEWLFVPEILAMVITMALPETAESYTEDNNMKFAVKLAAVADKYGWNGMNSSPEIGLGLAAIGFSMPAFIAYQTRKAAAAAEAVQDAGRGDFPGRVINGS
jgi:hypothetical protein